MKMLSKLSVALAIGSALMYQVHAYADNMWNLQGLSDVAIAVVQPQDAPVVSNDTRAQLASDIKAKLRNAGITVVPYESSKAILDINLQGVKTASGEAVLIQLLIIEGVAVTSRGASRTAEAITYMDQKMIEITKASADQKVHYVLLNELAASLIAQYQKQKSN